MFLTDGVTDSEQKIKYASIAQLAEHAAVNRGVTGSSPVWGARIKGYSFEYPLIFFCHLDSSLSCNTSLVDTVAVNCFAGLRCRWQIQQAENRKKHRAMDAAPRRSLLCVSDRNCHRFTPFCHFVTFPLSGESPVWGARKKRYVSTCRFLLLVFYQKCLYNTIYR